MFTDDAAARIHHALIRMEGDHGSGWRVIRQHIRGEINDEKPEVQKLRTALVNELTWLVDKAIKEEELLKNG